MPTEEELKEAARAELVRQFGPLTQDDMNDVLALTSLMLNLLQEQKSRSDPARRVIYDTLTATGDVIMHMLEEKVPGIVAEAEAEIAAEAWPETLGDA